MEPTLQLMRVNRLIRTAVGLVKGMELRQSDNSFEMIVLSGILWFKVTVSVIQQHLSMLLHTGPLVEHNLLSCWHRHSQHHLSSHMTTPKDAMEAIVSSSCLLSQIREQYPLSGEVQRYKRRDLRKGIVEVQVKGLQYVLMCVQSAALR